jgi:N-acylglucosamine 2-epimerase
MSYTADQLQKLRSAYRAELVVNTLPFWLRHGQDHEYGGLLTGLGEDGALVDTDKAIWLQGRTAWTFSTAFATIEKRPEWLALARSCLDFIEAHGRSESGKLYFTVTREGKPLRMRRYVYSECFAAIGNAAFAAATGENARTQRALAYFDTYLHHTFTPGVMPPKTDPATRPMQGVAPLMITIVTAQEIRRLIGDVEVRGKSCSGWIDFAIQRIARDFYKPELGALLEVAGPHGEVIDHFDGRTLNPGHAIECAWFILHEAKLRRSSELQQLGLGILDCMWQRGWDQQHGGLLYFTDLHGKPVQEYWAQMKFWWPHNEAEIATLLAYQLTHDTKYAEWHRLVRTWSRRVFADPVHGEWFGYAQRDGTISTRLKGNTWKGPFHLPRLLLLGEQMSAEILSS